MAVEVNMDKGLDKAYESKSFKEVLDASPAALAGLTDKHAEVLAETFKIRTIRDLGNNKYFKLAAVLAELEQSQK